MKRTAKQKLRETAPEELRAAADELRQQMLKTRMAAALEGKAIGIPYRTARRQIARIETILTQRAKAAAGKA
jgi:ribosomal protein L29